MPTRKTTPAAKKAPGKKKAPSNTVKAGTSQAIAAERRATFVEAYIANGGNATDAAIQAGYSAATAYQAGHRALKDVEVQQQLAIRRVELAERFQLTSERVLEQLGKIVYADVAKAFDKNGALLPIHEIPEEVRHAIGSIEVEMLPRTVRGDDGEDVTRMFGRTAKIKFVDKGSAIDKAMKHLGLFERDNKQRNPFEKMSAEQLDKFIATQQKRLADSGQG